MKSGDFLFIEGSPGALEIPGPPTLELISPALMHTPPDKLWMPVPVKYPTPIPTRYHSPVGANSGTTQLTILAIFATSNIPNLI